MAKDETKLFSIQSKSIETKKFVFIEKSFRIEIESKEIRHFFNSKFDLIRCQNGENICPEEMTCCQTTNGTFGCCPFRQGTCCQDNIHCCPSNSLCDPSGLRCLHHLNDQNADDEQICPDEKTKCSINSTCCPNEFDQSYSCCSYSQGVCCGPNGSLCCPQHYRCDRKTLSCQLSIDDQDKAEEENRCDQSNEFCLSNELCCSTNSSKTNEKTYFCCPFKQGICCQDGKHCCPSSSSCHLETNECFYHF